MTKGLFRARRTRRGETMQDLDAAVLTERLREGATLILDAANELSPPLQQLCAGLAADFACSSQANLYACWGTSQGFDVHWDDHDVLIVQVEGRKHWRLYGATRAWPSRKDDPADHPRPAEPIEELVLERGDLLYLPRGYWHAAVGLGEPTLHLTIGLTRKTGADFLHWLADHLLSEAQVRADLPFEHGDAVLGAHLSGLLARAASLDPEALGRSYRRHVEAGQAQRPKLSFPYVGRADEAYPADAAFALADGAARVTTRDGEAVLSWRGVEFRLAGSLETPLRDLAHGQVLTVSQIEAALPAADRPKLPALLRELVARGVLVTRNGAPP
ncbi:cupin domain-containing protein [Phenylobacterium sp.]|uniref:cupin domain-containing protein n=1 Tax=Phenylobacterium sp. TaxID=1871053 RepID=UPI002F931524